MNGVRRLVRATGWGLGLAASAVALQLSGKGDLAGPPLAQPDRWTDWLAGREPVVAAFALVRVAALGALWYLVAVTVLGLGLRLLGAVRMVAVADRFTVAPVRRALVGTVSLGMAASGLLTVAAPVLRLPPAAAQPASPPTTTAVSRTVTMHQLSPNESVRAPLPSAVPDVSPAVGGSSDHWTVEPGQCFWSIADTVLNGHLGRPPSGAEIVPYWRRLIEANRDGLAHRENPDLVFPGQVFEVPAP